MITQVKHLQEELARFSPDARITEADGTYQEPQLSYRSPATMCGVSISASGKLEVRIAELEKEIASLEGESTRYYQALLGIRAASNEPLIESDEDLLKIIGELVEKALK